MATKRLLRQRIPRPLLESGYIPDGRIDWKNPADIRGELGKILASDATDADKIAALRNIVGRLPEHSAPSPNGPGLDGPSDKSLSESARVARNRRVARSVASNPTWSDLVESDPATGQLRNKLRKGTVAPIRARKVPRLKLLGR